MPTDDNVPATRGDLRRAGLLVPPDPPAARPAALRGPGADAMDRWCSSWAAKAATTAPGATHPMASPIAGTGITMTTKVIDPGQPPKVVATGSIRAQAFPGEEVSVADLAVTKVSPFVGEAIVRQARAAQRPPITPGAPGSAVHGHAPQAS